MTKNLLISITLMALIIAIPVALHANKLHVDRRASLCFSVSSWPE